MDGSENGTTAMTAQSPVILSERGSSIARSSLPPALRAVILLGGSVRPSRLLRSIGRSIADLPVDDHRAVVDVWHEQAELVAQKLGAHGLPVRLLVNSQTRPPRLPRSTDRCNFTVETDPVEYRGTGGVLRDVLSSYDDNDLVLVIAAFQVPFLPVESILARLWKPEADVALLSPRNGTPCGFLLMRCGCVRDIKPEGFIDLKEQALPQIGQKHQVRVVYEDVPSALPVRTLADYIRALRQLHSGATGQLAEVNQWADDWRSTFSIIEKGAMVHEQARVHDSVVLSGARLEAGAVVVRSVVSAGATVGRNVMAVDKLVSPHRLPEDEE
jgi:hypothetical protein